MRKKRVSKKVAYGRIIRIVVRGDRERRYHATKGWRDIRR